MGHVLAWAVEHDLDMAARLVTALGLWWTLRGRLAGQGPLLRELAGRAEPGSEGWCAAQFWLAWTAVDAADLPEALQRCVAIVDVIGDREPSRILADCLALQSVTLANLGRVPEAVGCARRALAMARGLGYPFAQAYATSCLAIAASYAGDPADAVQLARHGGQIPGIPRPAARVCGYLLASFLAEAGDLAAAEQACAATLAQARDAGDLSALGQVLPVMADLDVRAGRPGDAAAHLREAAQLSLQTGVWFCALNVLEAAGICAPRPGGPPRPSRCGPPSPRSPHSDCACRCAAPGGRPARRPPGAGTRPGAGSRAARRGDEPGHRRRVRPAAHRGPRPGAGPGGAGPGRAQRPGTGACHPGRPGPHRRPDRRASCTSASAPSARTWTGSGTRPAAAAAPT